MYLTCLRRETGSVSWGQHPPVYNHTPPLSTPCTPSQTLSCPCVSQTGKTLHRQGYDLTLQSSITFVNELHNYYFGGGGDLLLKRW